MLDWKKRTSSWEFTQRFYELRVAKYWGLTPKQWDTEKEDCKAEMIAFYNLENKMASYDSYLREKEAKWKK